MRRGISYVIDTTGTRGQDQLPASGLVECFDRREFAPQVVSQMYFGDSDIQVCGQDENRSAQKEGCTPLFLTSSLFASEKLQYVIPIVKHSSHSYSRGIILYWYNYRSKWELGFTAVINL